MSRSGVLCIACILGFFVEDGKKAAT
jgi:hypothetical protein